MYLLKKRVLLSALMLIIGVAMVSTPAIAQETTQQTEPVLSGKIVDSSTQQALTGVEVNIEGQDQSATTNEEGKFTFDNLNPGTYTVTVEADGYEEWEKEVAVTQKGKTMSIKLTPSEVG